MTTLTGSYNGLILGPGGDVAIAAIEGLEDLPELRTVAQDRANSDGSLVQPYFARNRILTVRLHIIGTDAADYEAKRDNVVRRLTLQRGDELPLAIGARGRQLQARPTRFSIPRDMEQVQRTGTATVAFLAANPWWEDVALTAIDFAIGSAPGSFFPILPLRVSSSEVFASTTVTNDGDIEAWPSWTITGPGSGLVIENLSTGTRLASSAVLDVGDTMTIDTRTKTAVLGDGTNAFPTLSSDSQLFSLPVGLNAIQVSLGGAAASTAVSLRFQRQWLGP